RYVICAKAIARNCSVQRNLRTRTSPPYFATKRSKLVHGMKSMTCQNRVRPEFTTALPIGKKWGKRTAESQSPVKSTPSKIQINILRQKDNSGYPPRLTGQQWIRIEGGLPENSDSIYCPEWGWESSRHGYPLLAG